MPDKCQILLTNDDGIQSPGLWAAAEALSTLGYVHVVAPREQMSGVGRSLPLTSDGKIAAHKLTVHEKEWTVYAVGGTPAQAVLHGVLEVMPVWPNLVVSGINYGENLGTGVTISGTVGAALEAASLGIPALAASLQVPSGNYLSYSREIDFSAAQYFVTLFARRMLESGLLPERHSCNALGDHPPIPQPLFPSAQTAAAVLGRTRFCGLRGVGRPALPARGQRHLYPAGQAVGFGHTIEHRYDFTNQ